MSVELNILDVSKNDISNNSISKDVFTNNLVGEVSSDEFNSDKESETQFKKYVSINSDNKNIFMNVKDLDTNADELLECGYYLGKYKKVTYKQVNDKVNDLYFEQNEYYSSAMDILATYVKGQKLNHLLYH
jgi:hypothetical protein